MNAVEHLLGPAALARHGDRQALCCEGESITFAELAAGVRRAAAAWRALGAGKGDRVLILLPDTPQFAMAWLGALHGGMVAIAVNERLTRDEQRHMFEDSGARLFLCDLAHSPAVRVFASGKCIPADLWSRALAAAPASGAAANVGSSDPAFWLYSSGTTGLPKGIVHAHKDVLPAGRAMHEVLGLDAGDTVFGTSKLFFAYGLEHGLLGPLALGATSVLHPAAIDPEGAAAIVARHKPAAFFSVPSFYRRLLSLRPEALSAFSAVRHFIAAGERLPAPLLERWREATGRDILSLYGMSETFCVAFMTPPGKAAATRTGLPIREVDAKLVADSGTAAGIDEPGVLWLRHPSLAAGYHNRPDATSEQFVDGWFCTKDIFVRDADGFYSHQARADEFIKIAGQWVQPGELEEAATSDAAVSEAACVRVNDADGFERLALFILPAADPDAAVVAANRACEALLPRHKRPKWIRSVPEMPRTATGKIQRFKLRALIERELSVSD